LWTGGWMERLGGANDGLFQLLWYDIFVNCNCVAPRWQQYSTHLHTNSTQNDTKQTIHRKILEQCGPCPVFACYTLAFALQLRKKHGKTSVRYKQTSRRVEGWFTSAIRAIPTPSGHYTDLNQLTVPNHLPRTHQKQLNPNILFTGSVQAICCSNICLSVFN
jgi:hypothetical protein